MVGFSSIRKTGTVYYTKPVEIEVGKKEIKPQGALLLCDC